MSDHALYRIATTAAGTQRLVWWDGGVDVPVEVAEGIEADRQRAAVADDLAKQRNDANTTAGTLSLALTRAQGELRTERTRAAAAEIALAATRGKLLAVADAIKHLTSYLAATRVGEEGEEIARALTLAQAAVGRAEQLDRDGAAPQEGQP